MDKEITNNSSSVISIEWYDGMNGFVSADCPTLAICFEDGKCRLFAHENDKKPLLIESEREIICVQWNFDGSILAIAGTKLSINSIEIYNLWGQHLKRLIIPGKQLSGCSWGNDSYRLAISVDSALYIARLRQDYKWCYFNDVIVYAFNDKEKFSKSVMFYNTKTGEVRIKYPIYFEDEVYIKIRLLKLLSSHISKDKTMQPNRIYVRNLVSVKWLFSMNAGANYCLLFNRIVKCYENDENTLQTINYENKDEYVYECILYNSSGTCLKTKTLVIEPLYSSINSSYIIIASNSYVYIWKHEITPGDVSSFNERLFFIDNPTVSLELSNTLDQKTSNHITCIAFCDDYIFIGRAHSVIAKLQITSGNTLQVYNVNGIPRKLFLNCDASRLAVIDENYTLEILQIKNDTVKKFDKLNDVWTVIWSSNNVDRFACLVKMKLQLFQDNQTNVTTSCIGYIYSYVNDEIKVALLDDIMIKPESPDLTHLVTIDAASLLNIHKEKETRNLLEIEQNKLFRGIIQDNLPEKSPSEIRIFLSSTFKDFQLERNCLIQNAYEELRKLCVEQYQKDFIMIDLRWGITDEITNQQISTEICLHEIEKCKKESVGPSFVTFLSHRYGSKFLKSKIEKTEFELIKKLSNKIPYNHITSLLEFCYELDENGICKQEYILKSLDDILSGLKITKMDWEVQENNLIQCMRKAVSNLTDISSEEQQKYFSSVTEQEIQLGLLNEDEVNLKCVAFFRKILGIENVTSNKDVEAFIEDEEEQLRLENLKKIIDKKMTKNKFTFEIEWAKTNNFKSPYTDDVQVYLKQFEEQFKTVIKKLIVENIELLKSKKQDIFDTEILHHALFCNKLVKQMIPRIELIDKIKEYIQDDSNTKPYIVTGVSGSGKSNLLAYIIKYLKTEEDIFVYRFMGTSRDSSNMKNTIQSILKQLAIIFDETSTSENKNISLESDNEYETIVELKNRFEKKLNDISNNPACKKLVIVLDSIDQLSKTDYTLDWFIYNLPKHVKVIYSVIPDYFQVLNKIKENLKYSKKNYLVVDQLENDDAILMLTKWMNNINRKLTGSIDDNSDSLSQWSAVHKLLRKTDKIYPLYVKILFDIIKTWPSWYIVEDDFFTCTTMKNVIKYLFKKNERLHGKVLFSHCVFYLSLFEYYGLSESELEDILSIDDEVLDSIFVYHHPPTRRFQFALWLKIKYEIKEYITNKESDGVYVISWFHRSFIEASQEYYSNMFQPSDLKDSLLMNVIDYFTEKYNQVQSNNCIGEKKSFEYKKKELNSFELVDKLSNNGKYLAYRNTKLQFIKYKLNDSIVYNKRKLNELVHLISMLQNNLTKVELLKKHVYFNYEFIQAKCELHDLDFVFDMNIDKIKKDIDNGETVELCDVNEIYKRIHQLVINQPERLNIEVLSRLNSRSHFTRDFSKPCGLYLMSNAYVTSEIIRDMYIASKNSRIEKFYLQHNGPLVFIESTTLKDYNTRMSVLDSQTTKFIGYVESRIFAYNIQMIVDSVDVKKVNDLHGFIYFSNNKSIFCSTFTYLNISYVLYEFDEKIIRLLLLNSNYLLVIFEKSIILMSLNGNKQDTVCIETKFSEPSEIKFIESTIPKQTIFSSQYLNNVDLIAIIVGLSSNQIKIYKFSSKNKQMSLTYETNKIKIDSFETKHLTISDPIIVLDESFMIDNMKSNKLNRILIRFCIKEKSTSNIDGLETSSRSLWATTNDGTTVDEANKPKINENQTTITSILKFVEVENKSIDSVESSLTIHEINEKQLEISDISNTETIVFDAAILSFKNGNIVLNLTSAVKNFSFILIYSIEQSKVILKQKMPCSIMKLTYRNELLVGLDDDYWSFYNINEDKINEISRIKFEKSFFNQTKEGLKVINSKLAMIEPNNKSLIKEIDYLAKNEETNIHDEIRLHSNDAILCQLDDDNVLVQLKNNDDCLEFGIFSVTIDNIIKSFIIEDSSEFEQNIKILGISKTYLVLLNKALNKLTIYQLDKNQESYDLIKIHDTSYLKTNVKCDFDKLFSNKFTISSFNKDENCIHVQQIEGIENRINEKTFNLFLKSIVELKETNDFKLKIDWKFSYLNGYLILFELEQKFLEYYDINSNRLMDKIEIEDNIKNGSKIQLIPNSNDLLIRSINKIYLIHYDANSNKLTKTAVRDYTTKSFRIQIEKEYLFVIFNYEDKMEIYKLDELNDEFSLKNQISLNKNCFYNTTLQHSCIVVNQNYLVFQSGKKELCVFKLEKMDNAQSILQLNNSIRNLLQMQKYIYIKFQNSSNLMKIEIIQT